MSHYIGRVFLLLMEQKKHKSEKKKKISNFLLILWTYLPSLHIIWEVPGVSTDNSRIHIKEKIPSALSNTKFGDFTGFRIQMLLKDASTQG